MRLIHICPTSMIAEVDKNLNRGLNMVLTHLVLSDPEYRQEMKNLTGTKYLDNSFFELGYCMQPEEMIKAAELVDATHLICPDGTYEGMKEFKEAGYKVMCIPNSVEQFKDMMYNHAIDLVAVSEEHIDYRHAPGARYEFFRDNIEPMMPPKKIHLLGGTDSIWELGMLMPFDNYIESWDSSAVVWQGHLGHELRYMARKDCTSVDFSADIHWNHMMEKNLNFVEEITK